MKNLLPKKVSFQTIVSLNYPDCVTNDPRGVTTRNAVGFFNLFALFIAATDITHYLVMAEECVCEIIAITGALAGFRR